MYYSNQHQVVSKMKALIKVLVLILIGLGLAQLIDLSFYLMNQSDTYLFNLGLISFAATFIAFGFWGVYSIKWIIEKEDKQNKKEEL